MTKTLNVLFYVLIIVCVASVAGYLWIQENADKHQALITNNFGSNTKVSEEDIEKDEDVINTWVINYYANEDGSGVEMLEIKQTTYTSYQLNNVYSLGIQIINPGEMTATFIKTDGGISRHEQYGALFNLTGYYEVEHQGEVKHFNSTDGISFKATDELLKFDEDLYIIDIDGKPFAFDFNKQFEELKDNVVVLNITSDFDYFLFQLFGTVKSLERNAIFYNLPLKLNQIFQLYEYNSLTGKFDIQSTFGQINDYVSFKVNTYKRGALMHEDSLFGMVGTTEKGGVIFGE